MNFIPSKLVQHKIVSALDQNMVLDCVADQQNPVVLWKWHQGPNQKWNLQELEKNKFTFFNVMNSKVISSPLDTQKEAPLIKCLLSKKIQQQIWELIPFYKEQFKQKNAFFIKNSASGKVLDVAQAKAKNGQTILEWQMKKDQKVKNILNQLWFIEPVSFIPEKKAVYKIFSAVDCGMVWDVSKNPKNQGNVILYSCHKGDNQKFSIQIFNGKYLIISKESNFSVKIQKTSSETGAKIKASEMKKQPHEIWEILPCGIKESQSKKAFYIRSHCGKYLDITNEQAKEGAEIIQSNFTGKKNQVWFIHKI